MGSRNRLPGQLKSRRTPRRTGSPETRLPETRPPKTRRSARRPNAPRCLRTSRRKPTPPRLQGRVSESRTMSEKLDNLIVVLDIGSAWTRVLAADLNEGALRYRGHGIVESAGMRKGLISDLGPAVKAVKAANERAEWVARINIDECVVGVGGPHIRGLNTNGGIDLGNRMREIAKEDVKYAVDRARAIERPPDREIL